MRYGYHTHELRAALATYTRPAENQANKISQYTSRQYELDSVIYSRDGDGAGQGEHKKVREDYWSWAGGYPGEGNEKENLGVDEIKVHFIGV